MKILNLMAAFAAADAVMDSLKYDWYYRQCNTGISKNTAITSQCKGKDKKKLLACSCKLDVWLDSMFACMDYAANKGDTGEGSVQDSWHSLQSYCARYKVHPPSYKEMRARLDANPVTTTFKQANETQQGPFLPSEKAFTPALLAVLKDYHWNYYYSELFGMITLWYLAGIMFIQAVFHWSAYLIPGFMRVTSNNFLARYIRRYIVLPALFNKHRATPMKVARYFMLCFPPRLHVVFFAGYLFLSIFFLAFHYPNITDPSWYDSYKQLVSGKLAYRSGQLGMYKMIYVFLFAGRNNVLIWLTGWQFEIFNHWHRWIARLFTVDIIIHAAAYTVDLKSTGYFSEEWEEAFMRWGGAALVCMSFLCVNGTKTLRQLCYEAFLYIHIALAVFTVVGTYYHLGPHNGINNCWAVVGIWAFDRAVRLARIIVANPFSKAHIKAHPGGTMEVTIKYSGAWRPRAGTYIFIHFLYSYHAFQSHPFTVVPVDEKGEMKLYCKALGGITKTMYNRALNNGGECECRVLAEGPYGIEFSTKQFKEVVLLAGGIGITAVYSHLREVAKNGEEQIVHVHWAISNTDPLSWFKKEIDRMVAHSNIHVIIHLDESMGRRAPPPSEDGSIPEKKIDTGSDSDLSITNVSINKVWFCPDYNKLIGEHITNAQGDIVFFVCGPAPMSDAVRAGVANNLFNSRHYVQYYEESFSM